MEDQYLQHLWLESWTVFLQFPMEHQLAFGPSGRSVTPTEYWDGLVLDLQIEQNKNLRKHLHG